MLSGVSRLLPLIFFLALLMFVIFLPDSSQGQTGVLLDTINNNVKAIDRENKELISTVETHLDKADKNYLDTIEEQFGIFETNDGRRIGLMQAGSIWQEVHESGEHDYLIRRHQQRLKAWLIKGVLLESRSDKEFHRLDSNLYQTYQRILKEGKGLRGPDFENFENQDLDGDYKNACINAERAWIKYREAWAQLVKDLKWKNTVEPKTVESSVKAMLTQDRIEELVYFPGF